MNTSVLEANPTRSFRPQNEQAKLRDAQQAGASLRESLNWVQAQILSLLIEHGPVQSTRQMPFGYRIDLSLEQPKVFVRFRDETGNNFGNQRESFLSVEEEYPAIQQGLVAVISLLSSANATVGDGVFWISPMEFYVKPRLAGDVPSTHDVLNFYRIVQKNKAEVIVECQTVNCGGPLTPDQRRALLLWHDPNAFVPKQPSPEAVVARPVAFRFEEASFDEHYAELNSFAKAHAEFRYPVAGEEESSIREFIGRAIQPYLHTFYKLLIEGADHAVNQLIWKLVRVIKGEDAAQKGLSIDDVWNRFLHMMAYAVHPLTGESLWQFRDLTTGRWIGGDQCGGTTPKKESEPYCEHCHEHHQEGKCRKKT